MAVRNILSVMVCMGLVGALGCHKHSDPGASTYPTVTSFTPQSGPVNTTVSLTGSGFDGVVSVTVGGASTTFQHINFNSLTLQIPTNAATGLIALVNSEGSGGTPSSFYVTPSITSISPTSGGPGTNVTITGYGLMGVQQVVFGTGANANFVINNANQIQATVPLVSTTGPITLTVPASLTTTQTATSSTFTFNLGGATAPVLTGFAPPQAAAGDPVTLTGTGFTYVNAVTIGGVSCYATPTSDTSITVQVPPACVSGLVSVSSGLGTSTSTGTFSVIPTVTSFSPQQGAAGTLVTLKGSGFIGATGITVGGKPASGFIVLDANTAQVNVAPMSITGPIVVTASGQTGTSATPFTFVADATGLPVITTVLPVQASVGDTVTLAGSGFLSLTDVYVGIVADDAAAVFSASSDTQLTFTVPAKAQTGLISATNAMGATSSATALTVLPALTGFLPASGPAGTSVTITGSGFIGTTSVLFGGGTPASFVVVDANTITAQVPAGASNGVITVVSSGVTCTSSTEYSL